MRKTLPQHAEREAFDFHGMSIVAIRMLASSASNAACPYSDSISTGGFQMFLESVQRTFGRQTLGGDVVGVEIGKGRLFGPYQRRVGQFVQYQVELLRISGGLHLVA